MQFRILGPLEVEAHGEPRALGGAKQRAVLAVLLLHANRIVSRDRLIDAVWGEHAPETANSALQGYVSALRKTLGADLILTRAPGYVLKTAPTSVDLGRFESLVAEGSAALAAGKARPASEQLREALDLWRGEPLADLDSVEFVQIERPRLEELRLSAVEEWLDADLALGRHAELVPELHALVAVHPLRERLRAQLMLALYRSGRQAEALDVYQQGRRLLAQELGLEPGEGLKRLEHSILEQDPTLTAPARAAPRSPRARKRPRRRALSWALAIVVLAGSASLAVTLTEGGAKALPVRADSIAVIDTQTNHLVKDVPIDGRPAAIAANDKGVYVADREGIVWRIDPVKKRVVGRIGVSGDVHDLALGFGSVWLADGTDGTVTRIDDRLSGSHTIPLPHSGDAPAFWITAGGGAVWVTDGAEVAKIDPATNGVIKTIPIPSPTGLTSGLGAVWVATGQRLDRVTATPRPVHNRYSLPGPVEAPTVGGHHAWSIVYNRNGEVWEFGRRLTPAGPAGIVDGSVGKYPLDLAVSDGAVWTVDTQGLVSRIDPTELRVVGTIRTAPTIRSSLAVADGDLWVAVQQPR